MSLPISTMEYTAAKVLGNLSACIVPWLAVSTAVLGTFWTAGGLIPIGVVVAFVPFVAFCLMLGTAIVAESEFWAMVVMGICNVSYSFGWLAFIRFRLLEGADSPVPVWNERLLVILAVEITVIVAALAVTFYLQARKTDFA